MENLVVPNLLLISGTGRNSGKTTLACSIIQKFGAGFPVVAIKISSHAEHLTDAGKIIFQNNDCFITEEWDKTKPKDSSRMLAAGAQKSFFVIAKNRQLLEAFSKIQSLTGPNTCLVCESGGLRNYVVPGLYFIAHNTENQNPKSTSKKLESFCNQWINFNGEEFDFSIDRLVLHNNKWSLKQKNYDTV